jgi:hypothetical protein
MKKIKDFIFEPSLSRLWKHNNKYDCAAITAFRVASECGLGTPYTHKDNQKRNKSLNARLLSKGYSLISLKGKYPEGGKEEGGFETSFFVINDVNDPYFFENIALFGEMFDQDSVLLVPKGAIDNKVKVYLYGTNHCSNNELGYHKKMVFDKGVLGKKSKIYTSYVGNRPFIFEEVGQRIVPPASGMGRWSLHLIAEKDWEDLEV